MEQNTGMGSAVSNQYCGICGRQPLCGSCSHGMWWQVGFPMRDFRWERLTAAAAASTTGPRTAATGEIRIGVQCCQCRGQLDQEHEAPEHPLPIIPGRPVGWMTCPHCRLSYGTLDNGARIQHHSCNGQNREGHHRSQKMQEYEHQQGFASPDLVLLHTDDVPSNYPGTRYLWTMREEQHIDLALVLYSRTENRLDEVLTVYNRQMDSLRPNRKIKDVSSVEGGRITPSLTAYQHATQKALVTSTETRLVDSV